MLSDLLRCTSPDLDLAPNGHADPIERCPLLGTKRETSALSEYFALLTPNRISAEGEALALLALGGAFQWVQATTRQPLQPEAIGAVMEVTKWLKPSISASRIG